MIRALSAQALLQNFTQKGLGLLWLGEDAIHVRQLGHRLEGVWVRWTKDVAQAIARLSQQILGVRWGRTEYADPSVRCRCSTKCPGFFSRRPVSSRRVLSRTTQCFLGSSSGCGNTQPSWTLCRTCRGDRGPRPASGPPQAQAKPSPVCPGGRGDRIRCSCRSWCLRCWDGRHQACEWRHVQDFVEEPLGLVQVVAVIVELSEVILRGQSVGMVGTMQGARPSTVSRSNGSASASRP